MKIKKDSGNTLVEVIVSIVIIGIISLMIIKLFSYQTSIKTKINKNINVMTQVENLLDDFSSNPVSFYNNNVSFYEANNPVYYYYNSTFTKNSIEATDYYINVMVIKKENCLYQIEINTSTNNNYTRIVWGS